MSGKEELDGDLGALRNFAVETVSFLASHGVDFDMALSDNEVDSVQRTFGFEFPPDLRALLQTALPIGIAASPNHTFPNWRSGDPSQLRQRLNWPFEGIAFDIENNGFWWKDWGPKPERLEDALAIARQHVSAAPKMIPICSHRFVPAEPYLPGNPVFSIHQTDIIFYGTDLWDYFRNEFGPQTERWQRCRGMSADQYFAAHRTIPFWTDLVRANG